MALKHPASSPRPQFTVPLGLAVVLLLLSVTEAALQQLRYSHRQHAHDSSDTHDHDFHDSGITSSAELRDHDTHRRSLADDGGPRVIEVLPNDTDSTPGHESDHGRSCGARNLGPEEKVNFQKLLMDADRWFDGSLPEVTAWLKDNGNSVESWLAQNMPQSRGSGNKFSATINVYVNSIIPSSGSVSGEDGTITNAQVKKQIKVLNNAYASAGFKFKLKRFKRRARSNSQFTACGDGDKNAVAIKESLRKGSALDLYLYTWAPCGPQGGLLGYATFPDEYPNSPKLDGVVILYSSLPDGAIERFNLGLTAVHEIGHWLGLYHTFEGTGCSDPDGDLVADTPRQDSPTSGCPARNPDTCPTQKGKDPIHNYMDYSDDICMDQFTKGQIKRMQAAWKLRLQYSVSRQKP